MSSSAPQNQTLGSFPGRPRVFILTDITNEPDDAESFCRYLTYSNQFKTEGIVPTTSYWLRDVVAPEKLHDIIDGYAAVRENLNAHAPPAFQYPSVEHLRSLVKPGAPVYGMAAVGDSVPLSDGGELLLERILADENDPLWVLVWGGTNVLAQVLHRIRDRPDAAQLRSKLRVYTISDQDDTSSWIRQQWPDIWYISSVHGWNQYATCTWVGISGILPGEEGGPDQSIVSKEWLQKNIKIGPLGEKYPLPEYIMEGDTPTFLYLIQNGLGVPENPSYGSWGGRYLPTNVSDHGIPKTHFGDACDLVKGVDGRDFASSRATIWRWREAFQNDFAARMQWTLTSDFSKVNHHPVVSVNGDSGLAPVHVEAEAGTVVDFDASSSYDPDGDELSFTWFQYYEPSAIELYHRVEVASLEIQTVNPDGSKVSVTVPPADKSCLSTRWGEVKLARGAPLHLILEVRDNGTPVLVSYRRIIIQPVRGDVETGKQS